MRGAQPKALLSCSGVLPPAASEPPHMASSHAMMSLSLLSLTCLAGAGVGVGE